MGAITDDAPTPRPPKNLQKRKRYQLSVKPHPKADNPKKSPIMESDFFLPKCCAGEKANIAPIMVPIKAIELVNPWAKLSSR